MGYTLVPARDGGGKCLSKLKKESDKMSRTINVVIAIVLIAVIGVVDSYGVSYKNDLIRLIHAILYLQLGAILAEFLHSLRS